MARILLHDYAGHPFQVQLSRGLAQRGHQLLHVFSASTLTPRGELQVKADDPPNFNVQPIVLSRQISKYSFSARFVLEKQYANKLANLVSEWRPDVVLSANAPTLVSHALWRQCRRQESRLITWIQDLYGVAAYRVLKKKVPLIGHAVGRSFMWLDRQAYRGSDANVVITEDFEKILLDWGVPADRVHTIHNWAPLETLPLRPRDNEWAIAQGLSKGLRFLYSGTLSIRHNPELLLALARELRAREGAEVIVISEGSGIDWLRERASAENLTNMRFMDFQPFEAMADVFGSADVLLAILEPDAGVFCVPSKILSYMCAGRPLLLAIPPENLAARIVAKHGCGLVADPCRSDDFVRAAIELCDDEGLRETQGYHARLYAEDKFDFAAICDRFEKIILGQSAESKRPGHPVLAEQSS